MGRGRRRGEVGGGGRRQPLVSDGGGMCRRILLTIPPSLQPSVQCGSSALILLLLFNLVASAAPSGRMEKLQQQHPEQTASHCLLQGLGCVCVYTQIPYSTTLALKTKKAIETGVNAASRDAKICCVCDCVCLCVLFCMGVSSHRLRPLLA